ncbi:DUF4124 domain-containing protein [Stenotrophomonas rhizophila]|jgi:hypothetical protein|uniref:DUF4124 domain-containing protein n=1 Tax=Stenotrophomonas nematodicola TaxID=2656746 RepID=A0ABW7CZ14_9GAMM|nr:DUF4124 domain-containing protein [Stenotrophomonas sp. BIGb0135]MCS4235328.1 hypothetical protein [Stenotrophomonas sp. BIGb0135]
MRALPSLCCLLLLASASATAGTVYKWKDAKGVTQYSEKAPTGQKYESREVDTRAPVARAAPVAEAPAESADCTTARNNLTLLNGQGAVMQDTNGDGKADSPLSPEQRSAQKDLANAAIKVHCKPAG